MGVPSINEPLVRLGWTSAGAPRVRTRAKVVIVERMEYEHIDGPDGLDIRVPTDDGYRTCSVCGNDCTPDTSLSGDDIGVRIAFVCPQHGVQAVVDPFEGMR